MAISNKFCSKCGTANKDDAFFCAKCGISLDDQGEVKCPNCGISYAAGTSFCNQCGIRLNAPQRAKQVYSAPTGATPTRSASDVDVSSLRTTAIISLFLCWPVAIYGFAKIKTVQNALSYEEGCQIMEKSKKVCWIWCIVTTVLALISVAGS